MCTPENLRDNCSCPHLVLSRLRLAAKAALAAAVVAALWFVVATGYTWALAVAAWAAGMGFTGWHLQRGGGIWLVHRTHPPAVAAEPEPAPELVPWHERARPR